MPMMMFGAFYGGGYFSFMGPTMLALLLTVVILAGGARFLPRSRVPSRPGLPAPLGSPLYGIPARRPFASMRDRLGQVDPILRSWHYQVLWSLLGLVAVAGILVLGAILFGPVGNRAATAGLVLLFGWLMTIGAYFAAGYRALLPAAVALFVYGVVLHIDAVADSWGIIRDWETSALLLFVAFAVVQAVAAEAAFRVKPRALWATWAICGTIAAIAFPLWLFAHNGRESRGGDAMMELLQGFSVASLAWGAGAVFAFAAIPRAVRLAGIAVFTVWAVTIVVAFSTDSNFADRLQAAGMVAAAIMAAVAVTSYFVTRSHGAGDAA